MMPGKSVTHSATIIESFRVQVTPRPRYRRSARERADYLSEKRLFATRDFERTIKPYSGSARQCPRRGLLGAAPLTSQVSLLARLSHRLRFV